MARPTEEGGRAASRSSFRAILLAVALGFILSFGSLIGYFGYAQVDRDKSRAQQEALPHARALATQLATYLSARLDGLRATAQAVAAAGGSVATIETQTRRLGQTYPDIERVLVVDSLGTVLLSTSPLGRDRRSVLGEQDWFKRAATSTAPIVGPPRLSGQDVVVGLYAPVRMAEGPLRAVIAVDIGVRSVQETLARAGLAPGMAAEVLTDRGLVVARTPPLFLTQHVGSLPGYAALLQGGERVGEVQLTDGERRLVGAAPIRPPGWVVAVSVPSAQVLTDTRRLLAQVSGGALIVVLLGLTATFLVARRTTRGMDRLRAAMDRLEAGNIPPRVPVTVGGEVGALTESFNRAVDWLRDKVREYESLSEVEEAAGAAIVGDRPVDAVLPGLLRKVVGGMAADAGAMVIDGEEGLVIKAAVGFWGIPALGVTLRHRQSLAGTVLRRGATIIVPDVETDGPVVEPYIKAAGLRSVIGVPIVQGERVIGVVEVGYRMPHRFTEVEVRRLEAMARRAGQPLGHARALEEVQEESLQAYAERLEHEVADRTRELQSKAEELQKALELLEASQQRVVQGERLRALGEMAAGIAHDFNNVLAVCLGRAQLLLNKVGDPALRRDLWAIEKMARDGAHTVRRIQEFTRVRRARSYQPVDLNQVVGEVIEVTRSRWKDQSQARGIRFEVVLDTTPVPLVVGDPAELREALTNLIFNALDAMPEGGRITFRTGSEGKRVYCVVTDTGVGMPEDVRRRAFEPFFTTKGERGTGLGLSIVYGILARHGGEIELQSQTGQGSTFTLWLPVGLETPEAPPTSPPALPPRQARILVIEDEQEVRDVMMDLLAGQGHTVAACADGRSALARLEEVPFDLVFSDLGMPELSGWEVTRLVKGRSPTTPVALITGWGEQIDPDEARARGVDFLLAKPFEVTDVTAVVARALIEH